MIWYDGMGAIILFDKIDKNKDMILQDNEICDYRDEEANIKDVQGELISKALMGLGLYGVPQVSKKFAEQIREKTDEYRQEHFKE